MLEERNSTYIFGLIIWTFYAAVSKECEGNVALLVNSTHNLAGVVRPWRSRGLRKALNSSERHVLLKFHVYHLIPVSEH
jgi:hypothetical protein